MTESKLADPSGHFDISSSQELELKLLLNSQKARLAKKSSSEHTIDPIMHVLSESGIEFAGEVNVEVADVLSENVRERQLAYSSSDTVGYYREERRTDVGREATRYAGHTENKSYPSCLSVHHVFNVTVGYVSGVVRTVPV